MSSSKLVSLKDYCIKIFELLIWIFFVKFWSKILGSSSICCICFCEEDSLKVWYSKDGTPCHVTCLDCFVRCAAGAILEKRPPLRLVPKIGVLIACPICGATSEENWDCHLIYLCGKQIYDSYQLISTGAYKNKKQNFQTPTLADGLCEDHRA